jgi:hypothetical protein
MLTAPVILALLCIHPQAPVASYGERDASKWKPGPKVSQEIARLEHDGRQVFSQFRNGKVAQLTAIRELARVRTAIDYLRSWSLEHHSDEVPQLVVLIDPDELLQVFPRGIKHLPRELVPGEHYLAAPGSSKQWEYLGERRTSGMRMTIFRYFIEPGASSGARVE